MRPTEAVALCRLAKSYCPQQTFDEFTADAWGAALQPYNFEDCQQALVEHIRTSPFVSPAEIISGVKRIRHERVLRYGTLPDPPAHIDPDDTGAMNGWLYATRQQIANGDLVAPKDEPRAEPNRDQLDARMKTIRAELARRAPATPPPTPTLTEAAASAQAADTARARAARDTIEEDA